MPREARIVFPSRWASGADGLISSEHRGWRRAAPQSSGRLRLGTSAQPRCGAGDTVGPRPIDSERRFRASRGNGAKRVPSMVIRSQGGRSNCSLMDANGSSRPSRRNCSRLLGLKLRGGCEWPRGRGTRAGRAFGAILGRRRSRRCRACHRWSARPSSRAGTPLLKALVEINRRSATWAASRHRGRRTRGPPVSPPRTSLPEPYSALDR